MRPTLRCVLLFVAGFAVALVPALVDARLWTVWLAYVAVATLATGMDGVLGLPRRRVKIQQEIPNTLFIGDQDDLVISLSAPTFRRGFTIDVLCDLDPELDAQPLQRVRVPAGGVGEARFNLRPHRRGKVHIPRAWLRWSGPLGLVHRQVVLPLDAEVAVIPNIRAVRTAALRFFSTREFLAGLKTERYIGDGSEFESLREYMPGLDHRAIHWKASARHRKLLCQNFRAERNHQVIIAIDSGHLMREPLDGIPKLDHAINAGLLVGYFCLRAGDRIGLFTFDETVRLYAEPTGGVHSFQRLQKHSSEISYSTAETNFTLGLAELSLRLRRRSLVILLTDFVDTITAELMLENLDRLSRRHLVVFVTLRDPGLEQIRNHPPSSVGDLYRTVVASDFHREREVVIKRLQRRGIGCIDALPSHVSVDLLNRYLEIKRREQI